MSDVLTGAARDALRGLAEAASTGPWKADGHDVLAPNYRDDQIARVGKAHFHSDAAYIAACSPDVILRLLAAVEAAQDSDSGGVVPTPSSTEADSDDWEPSYERIDFAPIWSRADFEARIAAEGYVPGARAETAERAAARWKWGRDWQCEKATAWAKRCFAAEARAVELEGALREIAVPVVLADDLSAAGKLSALRGVVDHHSRLARAVLVAGVCPADSGSE